MARKDSTSYRRKTSPARPLADRVGKATGDKIVVYEALSTDIAALSPVFLESGLFDERTGLKIPGSYIGRCGYDGSGPSFEYDEYELYAAGIISNLNVLVFGEINYGKSSLVKAIIDQRWRIGRNSIVIDPKGEYGDLKKSIPGAKRLFFTKSSKLFINVLDPRIPEALRVRLVRSMARIAMAERDLLLTKEEGLIRKAIEQVQKTAKAEGRTAILPDVLELLTNPTNDFVRAMRLAPREEDLPQVSDEAADDQDEESQRAVLEALKQRKLLEERAWSLARQEIARQADDVATALDRWVDGDLKGPFHKETSEGLFEPCPCLILDCKDLPEEVKPMLVTMFNVFVENQWGEADPHNRFHGVFLDESWDLAQFKEYVDSVRRLFKLGRSLAIAVWVVSHHLSNLERSSDFRAVQDLVNDADTIVNFRQNWAEISGSAPKMHLNQEIAERISELNPRHAIWWLGKKWLIPVRHEVSLRVRALSETSHLLLGHAVSQDEDEEE